MGAPRSTSIRALRALSQQHESSWTGLAARRNLHITGAYSAQVANGSNKAILYTTRSLADLKLECERRSLRTSGTKSELIDRLNNFDMLHSRAFSIAKRRIDGNPFGGPSNSRQFNTSRANKVVNDTSTMDFAYMPALSQLEDPSYNPYPRVPMISGVSYSYDTTPSESLEAMKPQIYTVSEMAPDISASPMSEVIDNHSVPIDPFVLTETVRKSRDGEIQRKANGNQREKGVIGELWSGFLDDLLGPKEVSSNALNKSV